MARDGWDDDPQEDEQDGDASEQGEGEGEPEPELDEATAALVERAAEKRAAAIEAKYRAAAEKRGLAFTGEDFAVKDYTQFAQGFGFSGQQRQEPAQPTAQPAPQPAADEDEAPPEDMYDTAAVNAWMKRRDERLVKRTVAAMEPHFQALRGQLQARDTVGEAVQRAKQLLPDLGFAHVVEHPEFEATYRAGLINELRPEQWQDPRALAALAGAIAPDLKERGGFQQRRQPDRPRDAGGRYADAERYDEQRRMLAQVGASRDGGRGRSPRELSAQERAFAEVFGIESPEHLEALADDTGQSLKQYQAKKAGGRQ